jgi:quinol-cytochrome oxidoreductase complex cytochrome b subunit
MEEIPAIFWMIIVGILVFLLLCFVSVSMLLKESRDSIKGVNKAIEDINNIVSEINGIINIVKTPVLQITGALHGISTVASVNIWNCRGI